MESLEQTLGENINRFKNVWIVTDAVFSMTGELALLPEVVEISKKYGAMFYNDDAHGIGVMGTQRLGDNEPLWCH